MNKCFACKNTRRQLLMLKCSHDVCIKCAADNYFVNCKNKLNPKKSRQSNYFCENCLEQTELEPKTVEMLRKYFMENVEVDEKQKTIRRDRLVQRQKEDRNRYAKLASLDSHHSNRPKSLEIQIADRKRTLSKYLNDQQIEKFFTMQEEYQPPGGYPQHPYQFTLGQQETLTPHSQRPAEKEQVNEYELHRVGAEEKRKPNSNKLLQHEQYQQKKYRKEVKRVKSQEYSQLQKQRNSITTERVPEYPKEMEYQLYHNGRGVPNYNPQCANQLLEGKQPRYYHQARYDSKSKSKYSSSSESKPVGKIRTRKANNMVLPPEAYPYNDNLQSTNRADRLNSWRSEQNLNPKSKQYGNQTQTDYNPLKNIESSAEWEIESKSTKKAEEKTVPHLDCRPQSLNHILDTLQMSQRSNKKLSKIKQKQSYAQNSGSKEFPERLEIYLCKIHQQEEIIYFCLKCNQLICSECALRGGHKEHEIYSLKKSGQILRQHLSNKINSFTKMMVEEESKEKIYQECVNEINLEGSRQKERIKSAFETFIFSVDKKYKELLKEVQDKYTIATTDYLDKLNESRNNYIQYSKVKDDLASTLDECALEEGQQEEEDIRLVPASNQLGNFHVKTHKNRQNIHYGGVEAIHKLICKLNQATEFLKNTTQELFSNKNHSLLSERSSLRLSDSSNLLEEGTSALNTPTTNTPQMRDSSPRRSKKKMILGAVCLNVESWVKLGQCATVVDGLREMQEIVKALKLEWKEFALKALS